MEKEVIQSGFGAVGLFSRIDMNKSKFSRSVREKSLSESKIGFWIFWGESEFFCGEEEAMVGSGTSCIPGGTTIGTVVSAIFPLFFSTRFLKKSVFS